MRDDAARLQHQLVDHLKKTRAIRTPAVEAAFRAVPRHLFLPGVLLEQVYTDAVVPTKFAGDEAISSASQPTMMAIMLEQAAFKAGQRVLEIGAGTGYNAALIAHLVGESGEVTTIDIDADIIAAARLHLDTVGLQRVRVLTGDGWAGVAMSTPYDRILLSVRAADIAPAWYDSLAPDGRLILPLDLWAGAQFSIAFQRVRDREWGDGLASLSVTPCGFMPLRGAAAGLGDAWLTSRGDDLMVTQANTPDHPPLPIEQIAALLNDDHADIAAQVNASSAELHGSGLWLWLAARESQAMMVQGRGMWTPRIATSAPLIRRRSRRIKIADLSPDDDSALTFGLIAPDGAALLLRQANGEDRTQFSVGVRRWGSDLPARLLIAYLRAWQKAGSPTADQLHVAAFPADASLPTHGHVCVKKPNFHYVLWWA